MKDSPRPSALSGVPTAAWVACTKPPLPRARLGVVPPPPVRQGPHSRGLWTVPGSGGRCIKPVELDLVAHGQPRLAHDVALSKAELHAVLGGAAPEAEASDDTLIRDGARRLSLILVATGGGVDVGDGLHRALQAILPPACAPSLPTMRGPRVVLRPLTRVHPAGPPPAEFSPAETPGNTPAAR